MTIPPPAGTKRYSPAARLDSAVDYILAVPGKQLRSRLTVAVATMLKPETADSAAEAGIAIELLHTYSLVHDDLPAMDNDDMRRGRPTAHRAYDEATAILAGDGLQALAFEQLTEIKGLSSDARLELLAMVSRAVGLRGMVGGQALDLASEKQRISLEALRELHLLKTGALFAAAVDAGAICAGADDAVRTRLRQFAECIGLGFQVIDDVLDATASSEVLGKTAGKDSAAEKSTYVALLGVDGARQEAQNLLDTAIALLEPWGIAAEPVRDIARLMIDRQH